MTTTGNGADAPIKAGIIIISNVVARAQAIERMIGDVPALHSLAVAIIPIKRGMGNDFTEPRLIILDAEDGRMDPLNWVKHFRAAYPGTSLILVAPTCDPLLASRALRAGAAAYVGREEFERELPAALQHLAMGERYVSEDIMQGILHGIVQTSDTNTRLPIEMLSDREMMVFKLLGEGKIIRTIADELGVNIKTIATHCNNIRRKLHTPDNRHLTRISRDWVAGRTGTESNAWPAHH